MKKKGMFFVLLVSLIFCISFLSAADNLTTSDKAYACLENKVTDKCSALSAEERIFALLSIERCKSEVLSGSLAEQCWPASGCKVKTTAQAVLALRHVNADTTKAENWLLSQTSSSSELDWFLQVEADNETSCTATYSGSSHSFTINEDKTITDNAGSCLKSYGGYWLKISPSCYDEEFKISCRNSFLTSLIYKKDTSTTVYVSQKTSSASAEGVTTETVNSACFKDGSSCSYEGTLWASVVLSYLGYEVSSYVPYLMSMADENSRYVPKAFLYTLTDDFEIDLLSQQQESKWWSASGDKFYDTAVALLPFQNRQVEEKSNSMEWLEEVQGTDGCWQGNIRNTAFLLYSIWPKKTSVNESTTAKDCENSGYHCISVAACTGASGEVLSDYTGCFGTNKCCNKEPSVATLKTCSQLSGDLCNSDKDCLGGSKVSSSDTTSSKFCCVGGTCGTQQTETSECESYGGTCRNVCSENEEFSSYTCSFGNCCVSKSAPAAGGNRWLIIVLIVLILLVLLGILFRKKLRNLFLKIKFGKGKPKPMIGGPRFPPTSSPMIYPGAIQRRIISQPENKPSAPVARPAAPAITQRPSPVAKTTINLITKTPASATVKKAPAKKKTTAKKPGPKSRSKVTAKKSDIDEVLAKLKEIGK